jgi:hypothetical protein
MTELVAQKILLGEFNPAMAKDVIGVVTCKKNCGTLTKTRRQLCEDLCGVV